MMTTYRYRLYTNVANVLNEPASLNEVTHWSGYLPHHTMTLSYEGEVTVAEDLLILAANVVAVEHNDDHRPTANICPSASVGDVIVIDTPDGPVGYALSKSPDGFEIVFEPENIDPRPWAEIVEGARK